MQEHRKKERQKDRKTEDRKTKIKKRIGKFQGQVQLLNEIHFRLEKPEIDENKAKNVCTKITGRK